MANTGRSLRDTIVYLVTVTLTVALLDSFLSLAFSEDILALSENIGILTSGIMAMSV